jgi:hypothetical protein
MKWNGCFWAYMSCLLSHYISRFNVILSYCKWACYYNSSNQSPNFVAKHPGLLATIFFVVHLFRTKGEEDSPDDIVRTKRR